MIIIIINKLIKKNQQGTCFFWQKERIGKGGNGYMTHLSNRHPHTEIQTCA